MGVGHLRPRFLNLIPDNTEFFPEVVDDRFRFEFVSGEASGIELLIQHPVKNAFNWSASYGYAIAEDELPGGTSVPRTFDQRHTLYLDAMRRTEAARRIGRQKKMRR